MTDLYVVEGRRNPEAEVDTTAPIDFGMARKSAVEYMRGRIWPSDMIRPQLGEIRAWRAESGAWVVIRRATAFEIEEASK